MVIIHNYGEILGWVNLREYPIMAFSSIYLMLILPTGNIMYWLAVIHLSRHCVTISSHQESGIWTQYIGSIDWFLLQIVDPLKISIFYSIDIVLAFDKWYFLDHGITALDVYLLVNC